MRTALLALLLFGPLWADPNITLPDKVQLQPGRLAKIEAKAEGKAAIRSDVCPRLSREDGSNVPGARLELTRKGGNAAASGVTLSNRKDIAGRQLGGGGHLAPKRIVVDGCATGMATFANHVPDVIRLGAQEKMLHAYAGGGVATVANDKPGPDRAVRPLPGVPVGLDDPAAGHSGVDHAVAVVVSLPSPEDASAFSRLAEAGKESHLDRHNLHNAVAGVSAVVATPDGQKFDFAAATNSALMVFGWHHSVHCFLPDDEPPIKVPATLSLQPGRLAKIEAVCKEKTVRWLNPDPDNLDLIPSESGRWVIVAAVKPGVYRVACWTAKGGEATEAAICVVTVAGATPPGPTPGPDPQPVPGEGGLRVLMVYESADVQRLPAAQQAVLSAKAVRDYLDAKCVVGADGRTREWRVWDKDADPAAASQTLQSMFKRPRQSVPWIVISNDKRGYEGPLPANVEDALALLRQYGGN